MHIIDKLYDLNNLEIKSKILLILVAGALFAPAFFVTGCATTPAAETEAAPEVTKKETKKRWARTHLFVYIFN